MATSGSVDWTTTRDEIIKAAYRLVVVDEDFTPTTNQTTNASLLLNAIVKSYNATLGMPLWSMGYGFILPTSDAASATIPGTGHVTTSVLAYYLASAASSGASTITFDTAPGNIDTYVIGVALGNGDTFWTTISGNPAGAVVTLASPLTADAAAGGFVYIYPPTARLKRVMRIVGSYRFDISTVAAGSITSYTSIPMEVITTTGFWENTNSFVTEGSPLKLAYEPLVATGSIRWWPKFQDSRSMIFIRYHRALEDFDSGTDTPDFPVEWNLPLIYELAVALAPTYNMEINRIALLGRERDKWITKVADNDYEEGSISFQPTRTPHR